MKRSVHDPDYVPARDCGRVFIDGILLSDVIAFDTEQGWVEVYLRNDAGHLCVDQEKGVVRTKRVHGTIRFEPMAAA